jgi:hypothetical protein
MKSLALGLSVLALALLGCSPSSTTDSQAPTSPSSVRTVVKSASEVALSWAPATDNVGVTTYGIYKDGVFHASSRSTSVTLTGLASLAKHCFKVTALDAAGNESVTSLDSCAHTSALAPSGQDPTENWSEFARYGDYLSAQMKSLRKFGYGIYITKMQAADGPVCSTFWLYSDAPAPGAMPEIAQMWRWNEFDFEFVPYTQADQNSYITLEGSFPTPTVKYYGSALDWNNPASQQIKPEAVNWVENRLMTDDIVFEDMQHFYNKWMVTNPAYQIATTDFNFEGAKNTTGGAHQTGWTGSPTNKSPGWTTASDWKYPLTAVKPVPQGIDMKKMAAINWWRTPLGRQSITVNLPGYTPETFSHIVKVGVIDGSTAATSSTAAVLNNETYIVPPPMLPPVTAIYNPYTALNTYTIVWTKTRVAFYINAGSNGRDIAGTTPVAVFTPDKFPSIATSGTQAPQGNITWADTSLTDSLGMVSINLANYVAFKAAKNYPLKSNNLPDCAASATCTANDKLPEAQRAGAGWSGLPPGTAWTGADALIRSVEYYPLVAGDPNGTQNAHFDFAAAGKWVFDLGDGTWTAANFYQKLARYFGVLYAQDYTKDDITFKMKVDGVNIDSISGTLRDSKSPLAVAFAANADGALAADGKPLMRLSCRLSDSTPARNYFRLGTTMNTGAPISASNPFMFATIDTDGTGAAVLGVSGASTPLSFFAPPVGTSVDAVINLYTSTSYHGSFPTGSVPTSPSKTATIRLMSDASGKASWSFVSGDAIVSTFQATNPHLITVKMP